MIIKDDILSKLPQATVADFRRWRDVLYTDVDFNMPDSKIHSYAHTERVLLHALSIGHEIYGDNSEMNEILAHAALFHDTRRQDDYLDTGHGARGAVAYKEFCLTHPDFNFHPESVYLMRYHDLDDQLGIESIRKRFGADADRVLQLYAIFKDADALDRWRLGSLGLDPKYLRTDEAKARIDFAHNLVAATMSPEFLKYIDDLVKQTMGNGL